MKKVILLFIMPLAIVMADFTLTGGKLIPNGEPVAEPTTPVSEPTTPVSEPTTPVAEPTPPLATPNASGVIPNSIDLIWEDQYGPNTGWTSQTQTSFPQFGGGYVRNYPTLSTPKINAWYEIEEQGNGSSCSPSINKATNTVVEAGRVRGWTLATGGSWIQFDNVLKHEGMNMPSPSDPYAGNNFRGCGATYNPIRTANPTNTRLGYSAEGYPIFKPDNYWVWHGWGTGQPNVNASKKAVLITLYLRLKVKDPSKTDDRHLAKYVAHVGSDLKNATGQTVGGAVGISRFKVITNEWQPFNFLSGGITKEEFIASNPPVISEP